MEKRGKVLMLIFILGIVLILSPLVSADFGPKPTIDTDVTYGGNKISDTSLPGITLECIKELEEYSPGGRSLISQLNINEFDSSKNCYWKPSHSIGGQDCMDSKCQFWYYSPPSEFKLAVFIPSLNKVFISNEVSRTNFNSNYKLELSSDGSAKIYETTSFFETDKISSFIKALIITLILEILVAYIFLSILKIRKKLLISVLIGNLISLPIVWFIFPIIGNIILVVLLSEIFAFVFEAFFIYYLNKKDISLGKSFILSLIMNLVSFIVGGIIFIFITFL